MPEWNCFVVGTGVVAQRGLEMLARRSNRVLGAYSADGSLRATADAIGVAHAPSWDAFAERLQAEACAFVFALDHEGTIPQPTVRSARRTVIAYNASRSDTAAALLRGNEEYEICFRQSPSVECGELLFERQRVLIDREDSAFELRVKCVEAALCSFDALVSDLSAGAVPTEEALKPRSPEQAASWAWDSAAGGTLSFERPARELCDLVRALDWGPSRNLRGLPKLLLGSDIVLIGVAQLADELSSAPPGQVVALTQDGLRVATATHDMTLREFSTLSGAKLSSEDLKSRYGVQPGMLLPRLRGTTPADLTISATAILGRETLFARRLQHILPSHHPYLTSTASAPHDPVRHSLAALHAIAANNAQKAEFVLVCAAAYLTRMCVESDFDLGFHGETQHTGFPQLYAAVTPLRITSTHDESFASFRDRVAREITNCRTAGTYPLDLCARFAELQERGRQRLPIVLAHRQQPSDLRAEELDADLIFAVYDDGSAPEVIHCGALTAWQLEAIASQLATLAQAACARPDQGTVELALLDPAESHKLLVTWNETQAHIPDGSVHALIAAQAAQTPTAKAVRFAGVSIEYAVLVQRSHQLAHKLRMLGVRRGDVVVLCLQRSAEIVVAMLGILEAGAAYVPIDPSYPEQRIADMLTGSGARVVVTEQSLRARFTKHDTQIVCMDVQRAELDALPDTPVAGEVTGSDLMYVIYTSGSTGKPKGVEIEHRSLINHSLAIAKNYGLSPSDRVLCSASVSFDVAAEQIYPALLSGAEVIVRPDDLFESFARFDKFVREERITTLILPTAFWHEWVRELESSGAKIPPDLRCLSVGTEKALGEHLKVWQALSEGRVRFFQGYGPTEATVTCTMYCHAGSDFDLERPLPIGRPLPNTQVYVLDERRQPVPVGVVGELYVGGACLARGYRGRPDLTAERFIAHPFAPTGRLYRTGDLVRYDIDGQLVYIGRADFQVKIRGFRVELAEIEEVLRQHPAVDEAVVTLHEGLAQKRLVAYLVARARPSADEAAQGADASSIQAFVGERLPEYMVPESVMWLAAFPKTANQKVDRRALPAPLVIEDGREIKGPSTDLERELSGIWSSLLKLPRIDVHDDFFALGGNSLLAVRMLSSVENALGASVPLSAFSREPNIAALAQRISLASSEEEPLVVCIQKGDSRAPLWVVHPVGGHVLYAQSLRQSMDPKQPIFGLQSRGLDGKKPPLETIEEMADLYVELVIATQPHGPYFLAGPSMGGIIVLEMARRFRERGHRVALLAMLDTWGPNYPSPTSTFTRLVDQIKNIWGESSWSERKERLRRALQERSFDNPFRIIPPRYEALEGVTGSALVTAIEQVTAANERANLAYRPRPYQGSIFLLRAGHFMRWSGGRFDDPYNGWRPFAAGGVDAQVLPCAHNQLVDTPPPPVGRALQSAIDRSRVASSTSAVAEQTRA